MRYIWIISDIYRTPSAILFPQKVLRPSLPRSPKILRPSLSPDPRRSYVPPSPRIPEDLTCSLPRTWVRKSRTKSFRS